MKRIATSFIFAVLVLAGAQLAEAGSLTINPVESQSCASTVDMSPSDGGEVMHIGRKPVLVQADFTHATVVARKGRTVLKAALNDKGASKVQAYSRGHVGEKMAVLLGDRLVAAPVVRVPISGGSFEVNAFSRADADELARVINGGAVN